MRIWLSFGCLAVRGAEASDCSDPAVLPVDVVHFRSEADPISLELSCDTLGSTNG